MSLLEIQGLKVTIGGTTVLDGVELSIAPGEVMGLVGESGSGKSMTALAVMRLLPAAARASGTVMFDGKDILAASEGEMNALRGDDIGMVFQEPMTALNPVKTIGEQVAEGIRWHTRVSRREAEERARKMLDRVGLPEARFPLSRYPHELSGGQRQRVVIAIACALTPKLLIADEPTTALDVVLQKQILELLRDLVDENRMGLLLISHDLAVVTDMADRMTILRGGAVMEAGETAETLSAQRHPYTRQLAQASMHVPKRRQAGLRLSGDEIGEGASLAVDREAEGRPPLRLPEQARGATSPPIDGGEEGRELARRGALTLPQSGTDWGRGGSPELASGEAEWGGRQAPPLLEVSSVVREYPGRRTSLFSPGMPVRAVEGVSFTLQPGQSTALVGRSGCGKSTLARMVLALDRPTSGTIRFMGEMLTGKEGTALRTARRNMQVVFQDPYGSFNPRHRVERLVAEPLHLLDSKPDAADRRRLVVAALHEVGLRPEDIDKYPHEFSGGQRQRLSIARALITRPKLIVADEPVSALDVSIRAQILDLFADLNDRLGVAYLFITHDLTVARAITDDVMVMDEGRIVETGRTAEVLSHPRSEAAKALVEAAPDLHRAIARRLQEQG